MSEERTVWLYYELSHDGNVTGGRPDDETYTIADHLVEVPQGRVANTLLGQAHYRSEFGGAYIVPVHAYRLATPAEIAARTGRVLTEPAPTATATITEETLGKTQAGDPDQSGVAAEGDPASTPLTSDTAPVGK